MAKLKFKCFKCGEINEYEIIKEFLFGGREVPLKEGPKEFCEKCKYCGAWNTLDHV